MHIKKWAYFFTSYFFLEMLNKYARLPMSANLVRKILLIFTLTALFYLSKLFGKEPLGLLLNLLVF